MGPRAQTPGLGREGQERGLEIVLHTLSGVISIAGSVFIPDW